MKKTRSKNTSVQSQKRESEPTGAKAAILRRWQRLKADDRFDDRVTALCEEYDLTTYLPAGRQARAVITGGLPARLQQFGLDILAGGEGVEEGPRPPDEDFGSRLSQVVAILRHEFGLSADFEWLLRHYILWAEDSKVIGPWVNVSKDQYGQPRVLIEVGLLTSLRDIHKLWPTVQKYQRTCFPHQDKRPRSTLKEDRLSFTMEKREQKGWSFPQIARAWQKRSRQPTTAEVIKRQYYRARRDAKR